MITEKINFEIETLDWDKVNDLIPAIIQDASTLQVLMLGYMNKEALKQSIESRKITFYSRTKKRLWTRETQNDLTLVIIPDCDSDAISTVKPSTIPI